MYAMKVKEENVSREGCGVMAVVIQMARRRAKRQSNSKENIVGTKIWSDSLIGGGVSAELYLPFTALAPRNRHALQRDPHSPSSARGAIRDGIFRSDAKVRLAVVRRRDVVLAAVHERRRRGRVRGTVTTYA
jgi:hypothetical protein